MKKLLVLVLLGFVLTACGTPKDKPAIPTDQPSTEKNITGADFDTPTVDVDKNVKAVATGGICGGRENLTCEQGNICVFDENDAEGKGTCDKLVVDESKECSNTQEPVCGLRKGQKHGFLNRCYLEKHGAEFLNEGFCKTEDVAGKCDANIVGIGTCFTTVQAYEFDGNACQKKFVTGCQAEIPFETMEDCQASCQ